MSGTVDLAGVYSAIEESAGLMGVACSRDKVRPILDAYAYALPNAVIAFRVATNARHEGEFDARFTLPKDRDPYALARAEGLLEETGHPVDALLSDIQGLCPIDSFGVDFEVVSGLKKFWVYFPGGQHETISRLAGLPSIPPSLAGNLDFFARYGLAEKVDVIGIDYRSRTMNAYFAAPAACFERETVLAMHEEVGMPTPSEQMLTFCEGSFGLYTTLSWDSPNVERISYGVKSHDPLTLPASLGSRVEQFLKDVPYGVDDPKMVYAAVTAGGEEYYKLQSYYKWRPVSRLNLAYIGNDQASA